MRWGRKSLCLSLAASCGIVGFAQTPTPQRPRAWSFDTSSQSASSAPDADEQQIYALLRRMTDRWNAHDIEGYMQELWNSPDFLYVADGEEILGWQNLLDSYRRGYYDRTTMGTVHLDRCMVEMITTDVALALDWWTARFNGPSTRPVYGTTTYTLRRLPEGWKVICFHSSFIEP
ncbi:MAG: nuclear transport factor 2 family protein [Verrucomicrobia bacterium]|nr:nuclear transport factor 2 family protein [Verrucomicrobiota bacterium]